jgi:isopenicillin-N N-acyltransferase-like protein
MVKSSGYAIILLTLIFLLSNLCLHAYACTLWGAAGERVSNNGIILAKNGDGTAEATEIRIVVPNRGFAYLGLFRLRGQKSLGIAAGINEKGLALLNAYPDTAPDKTRKTGAKGFDEKALTSYDSVEGVLKDRGLFSKASPSFYLIADRTDMALVEIAPRGHVTTKKIDSGILYHTNHYVNEELSRLNKRPDTSSMVRLNRIEQLLTVNQPPFGLEQFIAFSQDRAGGPDNSIQRTGSTPKKARTFATWIVYIPKEGYPELHLNLQNPGNPGRTLNLLLDTPFWTEGTE